MKQNAQVYVIGGGIVGLCSALKLQSSGVPVVLLEAQTVCSGASFGNAGHLASEQVFPIAGPEVIRRIPAMLLDPLGPLRLDAAYLPRLMPWALRLVWNMRPQAFERIHQALRQINGLSMAAWQRFVEEWQLAAYIRFQGSLLCSETAAGVQALRHHGEKLAAIGVANRFLTQSELAAAEPSLSAAQQGALLFPQTGHVTDLSGVAAVLLRHFLEAGGTVYEHCRVHAATPFSDGIVLDTEAGQFKADHVLLAAGAFAKPFAEQLTGVRVPLDTERGYHLMLPNETGRLNLPVTSWERRFIMTPMDGGLRLAGTVEYAGLNAPPNMERAHNLLRLAQPMFARPLDAGGQNPWMGFRPSTADSLPVIDKVGRVLCNFGHQHLGLTQAAVSAEWIADLYFNRRCAADLTPYALSRFGKPKI
ncbi:FAD-binding oxidoreductase [Neisseria sp. ZJ106]|uniref:FAD-dependent oxidoreductase n=1 Tax=Neisseria lisongii TaxID=2912188 RepID=A0ABY7RLT6_9NEIS|nr:FAD-dependent oxidoreductase [Neisseria lisongii]MCF7521229.1 FAD-binding oxidoreductase [Neisseria lisongii]WCL71721.1 FAD-dependent oxidoreductase [Neisseria lisongii]